VDCGFCSGFACPSHAKGSTAVTTLRAALLSGNCRLHSQTRAVRLLVNGAKNAVTGVECIGPDGARVTFTADRYVLAASPIEDARLLFLSDPAGLGNSSGQVGRNLMFHLQTNVAGLFMERIHGNRGRAVSHGLVDFRGVPGDATKPLGGIVEIGSGLYPIAESGYIVTILNVAARFEGTKLKKMLRQSPFRDRVVEFTMQAEDAPQPTNRVDLDPAIVDLDGLPVARVTYSNHKFELSARDAYVPKLVELMGKAGARFVVTLPIDAIPTSKHVMGTLRFGADPRTSVCDPDGRFHDIGNLYAADGAVFPTSAGFNPTCTICALATRVAAGMVSPGSPERALPRA
jgi:choline dehydrogenase-like flavoprotein